MLNNVLFWMISVFSFAVVHGSNSSNRGATAMTNSFNAQIQVGSKGIYTGGKGILVRAPDFFSGGSNVVVPATFWVNDIVAPNQLYPSSDEPWCPHGDSDGFTKIVGKPCKFKTGPWALAVVAALVANDGGGMQKVMKDYDKMQDANWGWGVFYATDSNSGDQRCRNLQSDKGWDCPGHWIDRSGNVTADSSKKGAGGYQPGNPYHSGGGGGAGCHFDLTAKRMDQQDATGSLNLVQDDDCQCNYAFNDIWYHWVLTWIDRTKQKTAFKWRNWLAGGGGNAPQWGVDSAICWVNNPRDMIKMQNAFWHLRDKWLNNRAPEAGFSTFPYYWGWNEVPVSAAVIDNPMNWDAVLIKLPATLTTVNDLGEDEKKQLEWDLDTWVKKGKLMAGFKYVTKRPGSSIVFATELCDAQWLGCKRNFYCESWTSPQNWYKTIFVPADGGLRYGACYIDDTLGIALV